MDVVTMWIELYIDYRRVVREPVAVGNARLLGEDHIALCAEAERQGWDWRVEVTDPDGDVEPVVLTNRPVSDTAVEATPDALERMLGSGWRPNVDDLPVCRRCKRRILPREERHPMAPPFTTHVICKRHAQCYILCDHDELGRPILEQLRRG